MADVASKTNGDATTPAGKEKQHVTKPELPDDDQYKKELEEAEKKFKAANDKLNSIKAKLDGARPGNKDSPAAKRQQELRAELTSIRQEQAKSKTTRGGLMDRIKRLDEQLKSRIKDQNDAKSKVKYKSAEEMDQEIDRLDQQVQSGKMKLVDERKTLDQISSLRRQKKAFPELEKGQAGIQEVKDQISALRKELDDPETKALSERYNTIAKELDEIKASQDEVFNNLNALRDDRSKAHADQQEKWTAVKEIKDKYYQARRAYKDYEHEAYKHRQERKKAERDAWEKGKRRQAAEQMLEDARAPAFGDEIVTAQGLIRHFDPNSTEGKEAAKDQSKFAATAQRTVNADGLKGMKVVKKDEEDYFIGGSGKKGKKGRNQQAAPSDAKFNISIDIIEGLAKMNIEPPMNQSGVPAVVEKLKEKLAYWKENQDSKTAENIAKAQKDIDKLEADAQNGTTADGAKDISKKPAAANLSVNGKVNAEAVADQEKDAANDAAKELEDAKVEDATTNQEAVEAQS